MQMQFSAFLVLALIPSTFAFISTFQNFRLKHSMLIPRNPNRIHPAPFAKKARASLEMTEMSSFVISYMNHDDVVSGLGLMTAAISNSVKDAASLGNADETLQIMIKAVDVGPGSENLQKILSTLVNTPGLRQILQVIIPPLSVIVTEAIQALLPTYIVVLDAISKTGGHEGLLPDGIDVTMRAVQRLAAQGEIIRAFKVLQAGKQ